MLFGLCAVLLLAADMGRAATIFWSDGFETNTPKRWAATGAWYIGTPTKGATKAHSGVNCALTQNYAYNQDGRIVCTNYLNGGNTLVVPDASVSPTLAYWQWVNLANASGYVEISPDGGVTWQEIQSTLMQPPLTSGGAWLQSSFDLSPYAGQSVQIAFHFTSGVCCGNAEGWYVDDVSLTVVVTTPPELIVPTNQTIYSGQTLTVTNYATNSFLPNAKYTFKLLSPTANASIITTNNVGVLTLMTTTAQMSGTNTITVMVTDNSTPRLSTTNSFVVVVVNPWQPVLTVPGPQAIYAGQTLTVTNSATNTFSPSTTFTFALLSGLTNNLNGLTNILDVSNLTDNGVLSWTNTSALPARTYTNVIKVTDNNTPYYSATNRFVIVVSTNLPPPVLTVPGPQAIYVGQQPPPPLDITNISATNIYFPNDTYLYETNSAPAGVLINTNTGELTWTPTAAQAPGVYTISIKVIEGNHSPPLTAIGSFIVIVSPTPPPIVPVPPMQTIHAGQTLSVAISATIFSTGSPNFEVVSGPMEIADTDDTNCVLTWTDTASAANTTNTISVKVTDNNDPPLSTTISFVVQVLWPDVLIIEPAKGSFHLTLTNFLLTLTNTGPNTKWRIDASTNLLSWQPFATNTADPSGTILFTDKLANHYLRRFYRAVMQ